MQKRLSERVYFGMFLTGLFLSTVAVTANYSLEPIMNVRLLVLCSTAGLLFFRSIQIFWGANAIVKTVSLIYLSILIIVLFFSQQNFLAGFFGIEGRRTGFLLYLVLLLIFFQLIEWSSEKNIEKMIQIIILAGLIQQVYGFMQLFELDPIAWNSQNRILGVMGNPNYYSAFIGISLIANLLFLQSKRSKLSIFVIFTIFSGIFIIYESRSVQGLFVLFSGFVTFALIKALNYKKRFYPMLIITGLLSVGAVLDLLQKSPWKPLLYEQSVSARGTFWKTAVEIGNSNPILGIGFNGYRNEYLNYVDKTALEKSGAETIVDSPHNYFLEFYASGGVPLAIINLFFFGLILTSIVILLKSKKKPTDISIVVISCWVGFQVQALISPIHITLIVWGWIFGSLIVIIAFTNSFHSQKFNKITHQTSNYIGSAIGFAITATISYLPFQLDHDLRVALQQGNDQKVYKLTNNLISDVTQKMNLAKYFVDRNQYNLAELISRDALLLQPNSREILEFLAQLETIGE